MPYAFVIHVILVNMNAKILVLKSIHIQDIRNIS